MKFKKVIIVNYYGKLPRYASYFFETCKRNRSYHFVIFNDLHENAIDQNLTFIKSTLQDFNEHATEALGIPIHLTHAFKICDLRPSYGIVYRELIEEFDFWGFCDLDIILGSLDDFLTDDFLDRVDVYSSKPKWNSGSFSLYRNSEIVNNIFRATEDWTTVFSVNKYYGFDECLQRWDGKPIPISERTTEILSIYDLIHSNNNIRTSFEDSIIEWPADIKKLMWSRGKWLDLTKNKEFLYLHLLLMKNSWRFYQPKLDFENNIFVTGLGLSEGDHTRLTLKSIAWRLRRAISCFFGIVASLKKKLSS